MLSCVVLAAVGTVPAVGQAPRSAFLSDLEVMPQLFFGCPLQKIISGGQTGVDRAALAVAVFLEVPHGGWCPRGRRAEDGTIPGIYQLKETDSPHYAVRTQQNITDSDGTLVLIGGDISGGTALTITLARRYRRPLLVVNLEEEHDYAQVRRWLTTQPVRVLNVAGPRESSVPNITRDAEQFLLNCLTGDLEGESCHS